MRAHECLFAVYFLCFCVSGSDSTLRTEGRRVSHCQQGTDREKDGCAGHFYVLPQLLDFQQFKAFFGGGGGGGGGVSESL